jgi:hypothetical protein
MANLKNQTIELLPFHAINEFMRNDFRLAVVRRALSAAPVLPGDLRATIDRLTRKHVKVPGFRNSEKAPAAVKAVPMAESFEKNPDLAGAVLATWVDSQADLRQKVYDLLIERGWEPLPLEADRVKLGGFFITWPKDESFDILSKAFKEKYPDSSYTIDEALLMVVWITMHLPYQMVEKTEFQCIPKLGKDEKPSEEQPAE